jgi:competence protein ComEC
VIDGGPYMADDSNPMLSYMKKFAHQNADIEALIITHPHSDHFYGSRSIAMNFNVNHYYDPGYPKEEVRYNTFLKLMQGTSTVAGKAKHVHIGKQSFGSLNWGNELKVEVLYTWDGDPNEMLGSGNTEENNSSIVLRIQYGEHVFLLMGDAEGKERADRPEEPQFVEKMLVETIPHKLKATVLKVAHHGSETSSTIPFIQAVDPEIVVVQSGRKKYGPVYLPDGTTLQRYCTHNPDFRIYRTDQGDAASRRTERGAVDNDHIVMKSNGTDKVLVEALKDGRPFVGNSCR